MNDPTAIGAVVRARRVRLRMSQDEVAEAARIDRAHLTRIEGGKWMARLDTLDRIARALNTSVESLLTSKPPKRAA